MSALSAIQSNSLNRAYPVRLIGNWVPSRRIAIRLSVTPISILASLARFSTYRRWIRTNTAGSSCVSRSPSGCSFR